MQLETVNEDLAKVNRRASLHVQAAKMGVQMLRMRVKIPVNATNETRFYGPGYYNQPKVPVWYQPQPIFFPKKTKLKGYQKNK